MIGTKPYAVADAIKVVQGAVQPYKDSREAHAVLRQRSQSRPKDKRTGLELLSDLKAGLVVVLGRESEELTRFGFKPTRASPSADDRGERSSSGEGEADAGAEAHHGARARRKSSRPPRRPRSRSRPKVPCGSRDAGRRAALLAGAARMPPSACRRDAREVRSARMRSCVRSTQSSTKFWRFPLPTKRC